MADVLLSIGSTIFLLPADKAVRVMEELAEAQPIDTDYVSGVGIQYKIAPRTTELAIKLLPPAEKAKLVLGA